MKDFRDPPAEKSEVEMVVSKAFGPEAATNLRWGAALHGHNVVASATALLCRVEPIPQRHDWSLILKVIHHGAANERWPSSDDPADPMYWRREALLYSSGIVSSFEGGLRAPKCHAVVERDNGQVAIWLENVRGEPGTVWPLERYGVAARHLGRMQGAMMVAPSRLPDDSWLSRGWERAYVARRAADMIKLDSFGIDDAELTRMTMPHSLVTRAREVWELRDELLDALDRSPQTLCHFDFWPPNQFAVGAKETVVVDWAYAGHGAAGSDLAEFLAGSLLDTFVDPAHIQELETRMWTGYVAGLRDAGWTGDAKPVRRAFAACAAVKFPWMVPRMLEVAHDPQFLAEVERRTGLGIEQVYLRRVTTMEHLLSLADEVV